MPLRVLLYGSLLWESEWKDWAAQEKAEPLQLTAIVPIVFYTGLTAWNSNRTIGELVRGPQELKETAPSWPIRFWNLPEHATADLIASPSPWLNALAVVRASNEESSSFHRVFVEAVRRLSTMIAQERMRWRDLMWMLISWAIRRRPRDERPALVTSALAVQSDRKLQEEIETMTSALGQTLEAWAEQRGFEKGIEKGIEKGKLQTHRELLCELLEGRFGTLPDAVQQRIEAASDVEKLHRAIREFQRLDSLDNLGI